MCNIAGFITRDPAGLPDYMVNPFIEVLHEGFLRGRDGFGWRSVLADGEVHEQRNVSPFPQLDKARLRGGLLGAKVFFSNHRAEPTTEHLKKRYRYDQQPYMNLADEIMVVHNGTIANDKEILKAHPSWHPPSRIDSAVIPYVFYSLGWEQGIRRLKGSMALAAYHENNELFLYRNFMPLRVFATKDVLFFSSQDIEEHFKDLKEIAFPPYSHMTVNPVGESDFREVQLITSMPANRNRRMVVCSGGLDSVTAATLACSQEPKPDEVTLLHFKYGCAAQAREISALIDVRGYLAEKFPAVVIKNRFVDAEWLKKLGGSPLTTGGKITDGKTGAEFAHEWVPARNTAMIGIAASYADRYNIGEIWLGLNLEESGGGYADNTIEFYEAFEKVLDVGTHARPKIVNPLGYMMKHEIARTGLQIGAPLHLAWSCYLGGKVHCGKCGPCFMRRTAFEMNNAQARDVLYEA